MVLLRNYCLAWNRRFAKSNVESPARIQWATVPLAQTQLNDLATFYLRGMSLSGYFFLQVCKENCALNGMVATSESILIFTTDAPMHIDHRWRNTLMGAHELAL